MRRNGRNVIAIDLNGAYHIRTHIHEHMRLEKLFTFFLLRESCECVWAVTICFRAEQREGR